MKLNDLWQALLIVSLLVKILSEGTGSYDLHHRLTLHCLPFMDENELFCFLIP